MLGFWKYLGKSMKLIQIFTVFTYFTFFWKIRFSHLTWRVSLYSTVYWNIYVRITVNIVSSVAQGFSQALNQIFIKESVVPDQLNDDNSTVQPINWLALLCDDWRVFYCDTKKWFYWILSV